MFVRKEQFKLIAIKTEFKFFERRLRRANNRLNIWVLRLTKMQKRLGLMSRSGDYFGKHCNYTFCGISGMPGQAMPFHSAFPFPLK